MNEKKQIDFEGDIISIDLIELLKAIMRKAWIIVLCSVVCACSGFCIARFFKTPMYTSSIMLYVNNGSINVGNTSFSISSSEISAAQSLVKTYAIILNNRTTLEKVIKKSGTDLTYKELSGMIESKSVNDTEVLKISVTSEDPKLSANLVNSISEVLPQRISEVIHGSSMEVFDSGIIDYHKVSPSFTEYTITGFLIGFLLAIIGICVSFFLDSTIHDEEYLVKNYDYPLLVSIPDLMGNSAKKYRYYYYSSYYGKRKKSKNDE